MFNNCTTCGEPYTKIPTERANSCSNGFHCCRDCVWSNGIVIEACTDHTNKDTPMKVLKRVLVREVHISHREVEVDENATEEEIIRAGLGGDELFCEYSHTMDEFNHTIEDVEPLGPSESEINTDEIVGLPTLKQQSPSEVLRRLMYSEWE